MGAMDRVRGKPARQTVGAAARTARTIVVIHVREHYKPLLGELSGRTPIALGGLPQGVEAVTVPVRRNGESTRAEGPARSCERDASRSCLFRSHSAFRATRWLVACRPGVGVVCRSTAVVVGAEPLRRPCVPVALDLVRSGGVVLRCAVDRDRLALGFPESWILSSAWAEQADDELAELRPQRDPDEVRAELLELLRWPRYATAAGRGTVGSSRGTRWFGTRPATRYDDHREELGYLRGRSARRMHLGTHGPDSRCRRTCRPRVG